MLQFLLFEGVLDMRKLQGWKQYLYVILGSALFAASVNLLIVPVSLYSAGIVGIAQILRTVLSPLLPFGKLRELLRRERRVEFAFEGLRRDDIIRWDIAKDVLNGPIYASNQGTVDMDPSIPQEERATIFQGEKNQVVLEIRKFRNRYMPIPQAELDKNPNLKQTNFKI